jgi:DNA-binding CsgD family transcriptional regulator
MSQWDSLLSLLRLLDRPDAVTADGALSPETAEGLSAVVPCDTVALFEFHRPTWTTTTYAEWLDSPGLFNGPAHPDSVAAFWQLFRGSPFCTFDRQSGHPRDVAVQQDFHPGKRWRATPMYQDLLGQAPVEAEAIVSLAAPPGMCRRLLLTRQVRKDYDDDDRLMLRLLRPQINAAIGRAAGRQLTPRQLEVLRLAAVGSTYTAIGHSLRIAPDTARKHLENAYARLGARGRADAVARVFPDGVPT